MLIIEECLFRNGSILCKIHDGGGGLTIGAVPWFKEKRIKTGNSELVISSGLHPLGLFYPMQNKMVWTPLLWISSTTGSLV